MANPGDKIQIVTREKQYDGILMPNESESSLFIKLSNGYNIGVEKSKILKIGVIEPKKQKKEALKELKEKKGLKKIVILHTGGTIASKVDYETGGVIAKFSAEDMVGMFPELKEIANIEAELVANMMSEDMTFADCQKLATAIEKHGNAGVDGIIVGHGTDTLAMTSAALAFMFEKINFPVLIVGSQRSTDRGSTDGAMNLVCAAEFIVKSDFAGVAICMHNSTNDTKSAILSPAKTRKMHTSRRDAFKAINDTPIALVDFKTRKIEFLKKDYRKKSADNSILLKGKFENNVGLLKTHTNMSHELFDFFAQHYKAFVIEATGLGHAPTNLGHQNLKNYETLKKFIDDGGIVAITSQCIYGRVHPFVYANLRRLSNIGCIFCEDMLPETAFIKLSWLLGNYSKEEARLLLPRNLRGEITERSRYEDDFVKLN